MSLAVSPAVEVGLVAIGPLANIFYFFALAQTGRLMYKVYKNWKSHVMEVLKY